MSRFAPSGRPQSGLTLTRDRRKKLSRSGRVHPDRLPSGERQNGGQGGRSSPCRRGQGEGEAHPLQGGIASSNSHTCKEINTGIYFAFFVAPSGVILSSILLDSVSSRLLDNRSMGGYYDPPHRGSLVVKCPTLVKPWYYWVCGVSYPFLWTPIIA